MSDAESSSATTSTTTGCPTTSSASMCGCSSRAECRVATGKSPSPRRSDRCVVTSSALSGPKLAAAGCIGRTSREPDSSSSNSGTENSWRGRRWGVDGPWRHGSPRGHFYGLTAAVGTIAPTRFTRWAQSRQARGEQLGEVAPLDARELVALRAARVAVREVDRALVRLAQRRQERVLRDLHGDVVVTLLHAEVAREPAATGEGADRGTGPLEERLVRGEAHDGVVVAVRLHDGGHVREVR